MVSCLEHDGGTTGDVLRPGYLLPLFLEKITMFSLKIQQQNGHKNSTALGSDNLSIFKPYATLFFLTLFLIGMNNPAVYGQGGGHGGRGGDRRFSDNRTGPVSIEQLLQELDRKLRLSEGQQAEVLPVVRRLFKTLEQFQPDKSTMGDENDHRVEQVEQLLLETEAQVSDFLNNQQIEQYRQFIAEKMEKRSAQDRGRGR